MPSQKHGATALSRKGPAAIASRRDEIRRSAPCNIAEWQIAGERMLLYLKNLQLSPEDQLGLSLEAIRRVKAQRPDTSEPVSECLDALWEITNERLLPAEKEAAAKVYHVGANRGRTPRISDRQLPFFVSKGQLHHLAHPPMQRQRMISAPMELAPWRQSTLRTVETIRKPLENWLHRMGAAFGGLLLILAALAFK
jgi:hypothetical protein